MNNEEFLQLENIRNKILVENIKHLLETSKDKDALIDKLNILFNNNLADRSSIIKQATLQICFNIKSCVNDLIFYIINTSSIDDSEKLSNLQTNIYNLSVDFDRMIRNIIHEESNNE